VKGVVQLQRVVAIPLLLDTIYGEYYLGVISGRGVIGSLGWSAVGLGTPLASREHGFRLLGRVAPEKRPAEGANNAARKLLFYVVIYGAVQANYP